MINPITKKHMSKRDKIIAGGLLGTFVIGSFLISRQVRATAISQDIEESGLDTVNPNDGAELPVGHRSYGEITLYDYAVNWDPGYYTFTKPFHGGALTVRFKAAPRFGLCKNITANAKYIANVLGSTEKYKPSNTEIYMLAYMLGRERSGLGTLGDWIEMQRERASMLWVILNRIQKTGASIYDTLHQKNLVSYYRDFEDPNVYYYGDRWGVQNRQDLQLFVMAFFDGHFYNEIGQLYNWVHTTASLSSWPSWSLPPGTRDARGDVIYGTSFIEPLAFPEAVFSRGVQ